MPMLHLLCGMIASGKSTLSAKLAEAPNTIVIAEDDWLSTLYGPDMSTLRDYARFSARLEAAMAPHIIALLQAGANVVMDFQANTPARRAWMRHLIDSAGVPHQLHYLDTPHAVCKARLKTRNAAGTHAFAVTEAEFDQVATHFVPPSAAEGFTIIRHSPDAT